MYRQSEQTLAGFVDEYDLERGLVKDAARQYRYAAKSLDQWAGRSVCVHELNADTFNRWVRDISQSNLSPSTIANRRRHLLALWRAAADRNLVDEPPRSRRLRPVKVPYSPPRAWTVDEIRLLLKACDGLRRTRKGKIARRLWWSLAVRVAWESGMRLTDVLRLRVNEIQPDGLTVTGQSKTRRPVVFRLSEATMAMLKESLADHPRDIALPWGSTKESFRKQFALIVRRAGIRKGSWKWIRRSSATDVEKACPGAGAAHLGHAHGSTIAAKHYLDPYIIGAPSFSPTSLDATHQ